MGYLFNTPNGTADIRYHVTPASGVNTSDYLIGSVGNADTFYGGLGVDTIEGAGANDISVGGGGDDTVDAGKNDDRIYGDYVNLPTITNSTTWGFPGEDLTVTGDDVLFGGNGSDTVYGGPGDDQLYGGNGSDTLFDGAGNDQIDAGDRGKGWTDFISGSDDGSDAFLLSYDESSDPNSGDDVWSTYSQSYLYDVGEDEVKNTLNGLADEAVKSIFGDLGSSILLTGAGSALGVAAEDLISLLLAIKKAPTPTTGEDVLVVENFDPSEDTILVPLATGTTLVENVAFFTSAAVSGVSGWGIQFQDGVSGTTYAEVFLDDDYLTALGISSSSSPFAKAAIESVLATSMTIDSSGVQNSGQVYALGDQDEIALAAPSGTVTEAFGAFGPLSIVNPTSAGEYVIGGTFMGDILTVNRSLFQASEFAAGSSQNASDDALIRGFDGDDILYGGEGADHIIGDGGDDQIYGFTTRYTSGATPIPVAETLDGGDGNDFISIGTGAATVYGGNGSDVLSLAYGVSEGMTVDLLTGKGFDGNGSATDPNYVFSGIDTITGSDFADTLTATNGGLLLEGGAGDDELNGANGADTLYGGDGNDALAGGNLGSHSDTFWGGNGTDIINISADRSQFTLTTSGSLVEASSSAGSFFFDAASIEYIAFADGTYRVSGDELSAVQASAKAGNEAIALVEVTNAASLRELDEGDSEEGTGGHRAFGSLDLGGAIAGLTLEPASSHYRGQLTFQVENGRLSWQFDVADADLNDLAAGQRIVQRYQVLFTDARGDVHHETLRIGLIGANDHARRTIRGTDDDDNLIAGHGDDRILTGTGDDIGRGGGGADTVLGQDHDDILSGGAGDDSVYGGDHHDTMSGGVGDDLLDGGSGADSIADAEGNDTLLGGADADRLDSSVGDDRLEGGDGDDRLWGGGGNDQLQGGNGADTASGGSGDDTVDGSDGNDTLSGNVGHDVSRGGAGDDRLGGGSGDDELDGGSGDDRLSAANGNDHLFGRTGADRLFGGNGDDRIVGGSGNDVLSGGDGVDVFAFRAGDGIDRVIDFDRRDDLLDLSAVPGLTFADLTIVSTGDGVTVAADGIEIRLAGVSALNAADFLF